MTSAAGISQQPSLKGLANPSGDAMKIGVSPILPKISNRFPKQVGESQNGVRFGDSNEVRLETRKGGTKEGWEAPSVPNPIMRGLFGT